MDRGDFFKIVAVMKKKSIHYSYIPHLWEENSILKWPKANLKNLRNDPGSRPMEDWKSYACKIKKTHIFGLEEAELWENQYVSIGSDIEDVDSNKDLKHLSGPGPISQQTNEYEVMFNSIEASDNQNDENIPIIIVPDNNPPIQGTLLQAAKLELILANQELILSEFHQLKERMETEAIKANAISDKFYKLLKKSSTSDFQHDKTEHPIDQLKEFQNFNILPLTTIEGVVKFSKNIVDIPEYKNYLIKTYSLLGGTDGNEEGKTVAKKLKKIIFSDHVLTLFSWTGMSRTTGVTKKESFQVCEGIIKLFLEIIQLADSRWSETKNEKFFKYNTLKHAKQAEIAAAKKKAKFGPTAAVAVNSSVLLEEDSSSVTTEEIGTNGNSNPPEKLFSSETESDDE